MKNLSLKQQVNLNKFGKFLTLFLLFIGLSLISYGLLIKPMQAIGAEGDDIKMITSFTIPDQVGATVINEVANTIALTMPYGTNVTALIPNVEFIGASIFPISGIVKNFTNLVTYTVIAVDWSEQGYNVAVIVAPNPAKAITSFNIPGQVEDTVINEVAHTIALTMPYDADITNLTPNLTIIGDLVSPSTGVSADFTNPLTYTVTAADASTQAYIVTAILAPDPTIPTDPAKAISAFTISGQIGQTVINQLAHTIVLTMPYNTNVTALVPTITSTADASVSPANHTPNDFTTTQTYTVTAADSSTQDYNVRVIVAPNPAKAITSFTIIGQLGQTVINEVAHTIALTMPYGTTTQAVTQLIPTITFTGVSIAPASAIANDFTVSQLYTVTAQDGTTQAYVVTVIINPVPPSSGGGGSYIPPPSSAKAITSFTVLNQAEPTVINESAHTIFIPMPFGISAQAITELVPVITFTGVSIVPTSATANDFKIAQIYKVTAADGTTQDYLVTVIFLSDSQTVPDLNGNATLSNTIPQVVILNQTQAVNVTVSGGTINPTIDLNAFITGGTGIIPQISIYSDFANVFIPVTTVTSTDPTWAGVMLAPRITTVTLPETAGETNTLSSAFEIGLADAKLSFSEAVKIVFPNQAGKRVGYSTDGISFNEITTACVADNGETLTTDQACKIDVGADLVVWTRHFTRFATFSSSLTPEPTPIVEPTPTPIIEPTPTPEPTTTPITEPKKPKKPTPPTEPTVTPLDEPTTPTTTPTTNELQLFDISLGIEKAVLDKSSDLIVKTQFSSFGNVPTLVKLVYRIEDATGKVVFTENAEVTVETEQVVTKDFKNLNLANGKYILILATTYGDNVQDEFKQAFEVKGTAVPTKTSSMSMWWVLLILLIVILGGYIIYRVIKGSRK